MVAVGVVGVVAGGEHRRRGLLKPLSSSTVSVPGYCFLTATADTSVLADGRQNRASRSHRGWRATRRHLLADKTRLGVGRGGSR